MKLYHIKLQLIQGFITPWHSDTIFGHLCWAVKHLEGEKYLLDFIQLYKEKNPPIIISNGFPGELLPRPMVSPNIKRGTLSKKELLSFAAEGKRIKKVEWVSLTDFNKIVNGKTAEFVQKKSFVGHSVVHSQINRHSDTTSNGGELFVQEENFSFSHISIYLRVEDEWKEKVYRWFQLMGQIGYGKRRSVGKGVFNVTLFEEFNGFEIPNQPNGFVLLSNYLPAKDDPVDGTYKIFVKYGKIGPEFTSLSTPFKTPLIMIKPGSVFRESNPVRHFYGRVATKVSPDVEGIIHYGLGFPIPVEIKSLHEE